MSAPAAQVQGLMTNSVSKHDDQTCYQPTTAAGWLPLQTSKVDPRAVRIKIFVMVVDTYYRYSNELERAHEDIFDDFKFK